LQKTGRTTLILGLGNPLSGDDIFGSRVLAQLDRSEPKLPPGIAIIDAHTDLLNHIEDFAKYDSVILIDAILDPEGKLGAPGAVVLLDEPALQSFSETSPSIHQMSPLLAARLFRTLYPESRTQITLLGLIIDRIIAEPHYAAADRIAEAIAVIKNLVVSESRD
jgi:hydrogenase maturation protease